MRNRVNEAATQAGLDGWEGLDFSIGREGRGHLDFAG